MTSHSAGAAQPNGAAATEISPFSTSRTGAYFGCGIKVVVVFDWIN